MRTAKLLLAFALATSAGCAGTATLMPTQRVPAAVGNVRVKKGPNENTVATVKVEHLAPPSALGADRTVYVVWARQAGASQWVNLGQLQVGESRAGEVEVRTPFPRFALSVTAETQGTVEVRSDYVVLEGQIDAP